jgi:hypothetical protein
MAKPDKAGQRAILILQLGRLLAPLYDLAEMSTPPTWPSWRNGEIMQHVPLFLRFSRKAYVYRVSGRHGEISAGL